MRARLALQCGADIFPTSRWNRVHFHADEISSGCVSPFGFFFLFLKGLRLSNCELYIEVHAFFE